MKLILTQNDIEEMMRRIMDNLNPKTKCYRWVAVRDLTGFGSTVSIALCEFFDKDPHEIIKPK